jgi:hypothetical protein
VARIFDKLNLKDQTEILILDAPASFEKEVETLDGVEVQRRLSVVRRVSFALAFVTRKSDVDSVSRSLAAKADGDAILWFAYPKGSSKTYTCDFNRDSGWDVIKAAGFDSVRQVAIDEDWSALRFRRKQFIRPKS